MCQQEIIHLCGHSSTRKLPSCPARKAQRSNCCPIPSSHSTILSNSHQCRNRPAENSIELCRPCFVRDREAWAAQRAAQQAQARDIELMPMAPPRVKKPTTDFWETDEGSSSSSTGPRQFPSPAVGAPMYSSSKTIAPPSHMWVDTCRPSTARNRALTPAVPSGWVDPKELMLSSGGGGSQFPRARDGDAKYSSSRTLAPPSHLWVDTCRSHPAGDVAVSPIVSGWADPGAVSPQRSSRGEAARRRVLDGRGNFF